MFDSRRNLLFAGIGLVLLLALVAVLISVSINSQPTCNLSSVEPRFEENSEKNVVAKDLTAIARIAAFFEYALEDQQDPPEGTDIFMALKLDSLSANKDSGKLTMQLKLNCSELTFHLHSIGEGRLNSTVVDEILVKLHKPNLGFSECKITSVGRLDYNNNGFHYVCDKKTRYNCFAERDDQTFLVTALIVDDFEFELFGDKEEYKEGKFSTLQSTCL